MHPASFRRSIGPIFPRTFGRELEVLAELFVSGLRPKPQHVFTELIPVEVECERIEEQRLGNEVVEGKHAYLLEEVREQNVVILLEILLEKPSESRARRVAVEHVRDADEGLRVLWKNTSEVR